MKSDQEIVNNFLENVSKLRNACQEAKADKGKPDIYLVPPEIFEAIAYIRMYGNEKYHDPDNWKTVEIERYYSAAMRHMLAWRRGETVDKESGYSHLWHAACNLAFMISLEDQEIGKANEEIMREALNARDIG